MQFIGDHSYEIDGISREEWMKSLMQFSDANIYQTWEFGEARWGHNKLNRIMIMECGKMVGMAQVRILRFPLVGGGFSYIHRGPVWRSRSGLSNNDTFRGILRVLKKIYVENQGFLLRILPNEIENENQELINILENECFSPIGSKGRVRTIFIDLSKNLDELKSGMRKTWRQSLGYAEKKGLDLNFGTDIARYDIALALNEEMEKRKKFQRSVDFKMFRKVQETLPVEKKMKILICNYQDQPIGSMIWAEFGDVGLPIIAATGNKALDTNCSYLLMWKMIKIMKESGLRWCDLGGISKEQNPGGYIFKTGLAGKGGLHVRFLGRFDASNRSKSWMIIKLIDAIREKRAHFDSFLFIWKNKLRS